MRGVLPGAHTPQSASASTRFSYHPNEYSYTLTQRLKGKKMVVVPLSRIRLATDQEKALFPGVAATCARQYQLTQCGESINLIADRFPLSCCLAEAAKAEFWVHFAGRALAAPSYAALGALLLDMKRNTRPEAYHAGWLAQRGAAWEEEAAAATSAGAVWRLIMELGGLDKNGKSPEVDIGTEPRGFDWSGFVNDMWDAETVRHPRFARSSEDGISDLSLDASSPPAGGRDPVR